MLTDGLQQNGRPFWSIATYRGRYLDKIRYYKLRNLTVISTCFMSCLEVPRDEIQYQRYELDQSY